jgi:hypothetical protein
MEGLHRRRALFVLALSCDIYGLLLYYCTTAMGTCPETPHNRHGSRPSKTMHGTPCAPRQVEKGSPYPRSEVKESRGVCHRKSHYKMARKAKCAKQINGYHRPCLGSSFTGCGEIAMRWRFRRLVVSSHMGTQIPLEHAGEGSNLPRLLRSATVKRLP